ncbi:MAG: DNA-binding response OmpR family regulator [Bradymonadia bacterium]|jgi:DNA-binding response OmpR family regulator
MSSETRLPHILICDDDSNIRAILRAHLEEHECTIVEAIDGEQGLEAILVEKPDLVLLDVMMPQLNGWEIAKYVRMKQELKATKIFMLTAIGSKVNELTSPLYGADAYLDKPFDLEELDATIGKLLNDAGLAWKERDAE